MIPPHLNVSPAGPLALHSPPCGCSSFGFNSTPNQEIVGDYRHA